jgi:hypothetical protein
VSFVVCAISKTLAQARNWKVFRRLDSPDLSYPDALAIDGIPDPITVARTLCLALAFRGTITRCVFPYRARIVALRCFVFAVSWGASVSVSSRVLSSSPFFICVGICR